MIRRADCASPEAGHAVVPVLAIFALLLMLGFSLITTTHADFQIAGTYRDMTEARYLAESGLQAAVAYQNDNTLSPRYLFDAGTYQGPGVDPLFKAYSVRDPESNELIATIDRRVVGGKNPLINTPPYRVRSSATVRGSLRTLEAEIAPLSLLEYALWTEDSVGIAPYITYTGKVYSASYITLNGPPITFHRKVEYVTNLNGAGYGTYHEGNVRLTGPKPSLTALVSLSFYDQASKNPDVCGNGYGLYIGPGMPYTSLFTRTGGGYQIDLSLFDLSGPFKTPATAITYMGTPLVRYDDTSKPLKDFNGIIYVDDTLHIWGINGGRSVEDAAWRDDTTGNPSGKRYQGPYGVGKNWYSNHQLDPGEDGTGGGTVNGILDPANKGRSLTIVTRTGRDIWLDHNIFMGQNDLGIPVRTALISGRALHITENAPKTMVLHAALLGMGGSNCSGSASSYTWYPCGDHDQHADNWWARIPFTSPAEYRYDLDHDDSLESNNGATQSYDRNENSMLSAWSLQVLGNRIFQGRPSSGHWASADGHLRFYSYDDTLVIYEPPCYPVLPEYDLVPGSVVEIR